VWWPPPPNTHTCTHTHMHTHTCTHTHTHAHTCTHTHTRTHTHMHTHIHAHTHTYTCTHTHTHKRGSVSHLGDRRAHSGGEGAAVRHHQRGWLTLPRLPLPLALALPLPGAPACAMLHTPRPPLRCRSSPGGGCPACAVRGVCVRPPRGGGHHSCLQRQGGSAEAAFDSAGSSACSQHKRLRPCACWPPTQTRPGSCG